MQLLKHLVLVVLIVTPLITLGQTASVLPSKVPVAAPSPSVSGLLTIGVSSGAKGAAAGKQVIGKWLVRVCTDSTAALTLNSLPSGTPAVSYVSSGTTVNRNGNQGLIGEPQFPNFRSFVGLTEADPLYAVGPANGYDVSSNCVEYIAATGKAAARVEFPIELGTDYSMNFLVAPGQLEDDGRAVWISAPPLHPGIPLQRYFYQTAISGGTDFYDNFGGQSSVPGGYNFFIHFQLQSK